MEVPNGAGGFALQYKLLESISEVKEIIMPADEIPNVPQELPESPPMETPPLPNPIEPILPDTPEPEPVDTPEPNK